MADKHLGRAPIGSAVLLIILLTMIAFSRGPVFGLAPLFRVVPLRPRWLTPPQHNCDALSEVASVLARPMDCGGPCVHASTAWTFAADSASRLIMSSPRCMSATVAQSVQLRCQVLFLGRNASITDEHDPFSKFVRWV